MSAKLSARAVAYALSLTIWVIVSLVLGQSVAAVMVGILPGGINDAVLATIFAALGYIFAMGLAIGIPSLIWRMRPSRTTLGMARLPSWSDIALSILAVLPYYVVSGIFVWLGMEVFRVIDPSVGQEIPFQNMSLRIEYVVAFVTLVILAPLAEELLFRGYFLGRMKERTGKWLALFVTSVVFGLMHLPGFGDNGLALQWSAAADTFALGLIAGSLRLLTGTIWAGVLLHSIKNGIAYYFLFINPLPPGGM